MTSIQAILEANTVHRIDVGVPDRGEIIALQAAVGKELPAAYLEFLDLGGLGDLRFTFEVLGPVEIGEQLHYVERCGMVPFASDGCGNLACWPLTKLPGSEVYFWDHETDACEPMFASFEEALGAWRF